MFEHMTFEKILADALTNVKSDIDKREGSVVYDAIAPVCAELAKAYIELDRVLDESFADTSSRAFLIRRAEERGLKPYDATYAKVVAELTGDFEISEGARFNYGLGEINYVYEGETLVKGGNVYYILRCETLGTVGNVDSGRLIPIESISGLEKAEVTSIFSFGEDEEDTENFRLRYFEHLKGIAYGGNIADYKQKVKAISGVGGVRVFPVWKGGGTVKLVITDSEYSGFISSDFVKSVAEMIDPANNSGEGRGIAPIGHKVTVEGATGVDIAVSVSGIDYAEGYNFESVKNDLLNTAKEYFTELNKTFENVDKIVIYLYTLASRLLNVEGILSISDVYIESQKSNYLLGDSEVVEIRNVEILEVG